MKPKSKKISSNKFVVTQRNIIPNWAPDQCGIFKMQYLFPVPPYPKNRSITFFLKEAIYHKKPPQIQHLINKEIEQESSNMT